MVATLREADKTSVTEGAKKRKVSEQTIYARCTHFGGLEPVDVKRLKALELDNAKLKKLLADSRQNRAGKFTMNEICFPCSSEQDQTAVTSLWPCLFKETWHFFLKLHKPMLAERFRPCQFQLRMRFQHALQYRLLGGFEIHKKDVFIVF